MKKLLGLYPFSCSGRIIQVFAERRKYRSATFTWLYCLEKELHPETGDPHKYVDICGAPFQKIKPSKQEIQKCFNDYIGENR